ncbi:MAG: ABC transporter ATP-binding protein [Erysipelotrichaceae bacterium]|nr:ABC transporter ATP-binding protein [Erysipelotrichaceae bacterium]
MEKIIEVKNLHKAYGKIQAVKGIDFYVEKGKLFAFLGPNGAGKSTTIDIICTFLKQDEGEVLIDGYQLGKDDIHIRNIVGAVFQDGLLDPLLTVEENLRARGSLYGLKGQALKEAINQTAERTMITEFLKRPYGKLSGGQRRRCDIARALINTPKILFLDEPTTGLDPQTRKSVWEMIADIQKTNQTTIFLTTHYMEEAVDADYVIVIDHGNIVAKGTPIELRDKYSADRIIMDADDVSTITNILDSNNIDYVIEDKLVKVVLKTTKDSLHIIDLCREHLRGFEVIRGTMDDAFITITGRELR